ncbi:homogentisate phytyltransferase 1 [Hibiscus syriacus]|uniref:Homogentisate phytyltransferase 1 n=1 Tax=Hibiscus syriacus TaxID=106335 RepID=A0A6A2WUA3_HIBSY|nr:homogentisate phytyltransferase 1 [Hibiscus syriacus]
MKKRISARLRTFLRSSHASSAFIPNSIDVREEYANALRTESYNEFWTRVLALSHLDFSTSISPIDSTTAARLPSYRLFAEHLLDPDQASVTRILTLTQTQPKTRTLLSDYFSQTADASLVCGLLLKDIDSTRVRYRSFRASFQTLEIAPFSDGNQLSGILTRLIEFTNSPNPFKSTSPSSSKVPLIQAGCCELLKRLESSRDKARSKLQIVTGLEHGSGIFLVALTASLTIIVASHALALLVAAPGLIAVSLELASARRLGRESAQLDAAAKGTYILNRDLDTISRLVARLNDELEDICAMVKLWLAGREDRLQPGGEVARQLKKNDANFTQQLDELEEHLYLCFMTINRARNLVVREILNPGPLSIRKSAPI